MLLGCVVECWWFDWLLENVCGGQSVVFVVCGEVGVGKIVLL